MRTHHRVTYWARILAHRVYAIRIHACNPNHRVGEAGGFLYPGRYSRTRRHHSHFRLPCRREERKLRGLSMERVQGPVTASQKQIVYKTPITLNAGGSNTALLVNSPRRGASTERTSSCERNSIPYPPHSYPLNPRIYKLLAVRKRTQSTPVCIGGGIPVEVSHLPPLVQRKPDWNGDARRRLATPNQV
jgi:hypothetical protein